MSTEHNDGRPTFVKGDVVRMTAHGISSGIVSERNRHDVASGKECLGVVVRTPRGTDVVCVRQNNMKLASYYSTSFWEPARATTKGAE